MTARELHDHLGRLLDDHVVDGNAEVFIGFGAGDVLMRFTHIDPETHKDVAKKMVDNSARLCFGRLT